MHTERQIPSSSRWMQLTESSTQSPPPMPYVPSYKSIYFNLSKLDFTQLLILSLLSKSFFWRTSPTPPGAPNFSTMALVFLNCFSSIKCWTHLRYVSRVCFSGGTGTFGNTWGHKINTPVWNTQSVLLKQSSCWLSSCFTFGSPNVQQIKGPLTHMFS